MLYNSGLLFSLFKSLYKKIFLKKASYPNSPHSPLNTIFHCSVKDADYFFKTSDARPLTASTRCFMQNRENRRMHCCAILFWMTQPLHRPLFACSRCSFGIRRIQAVYMYTMTHRRRSSRTRESSLRRSSSPYLYTPECTTSAIKMRRPDAMLVAHI